MFSFGNGGFGFSIDGGHHHHHHGDLFGGFIPNVLEMPFSVPNYVCPDNSNAQASIGFTPFTNSVFNNPYSVTTPYTAETPITIRVAPARAVSPAEQARRRNERAERVIRFEKQKSIKKQKEALLAEQQRIATFQQKIRRSNQNEARQNATYDNHLAIIAYAQSLTSNAYNLLRKKLNSTPALVNLPTSDLSKRGLPIGEDGKNLFQAIFENPNFSDSDKSDLFGDLLIRCHYDLFYSELFTNSLIHHLMSHIDLLHVCYLKYGIRALVTLSAENEEKIWITLIKSAKNPSVLMMDELIGASPKADTVEGIPDAKQDDTSDLDEEKPYSINKLIIVFNALPQAKKNGFAKLCVTHFLAQNSVDILKSFYCDLLQHKNTSYVQENEGEIWKKLFSADPESGFEIRKTIIWQANLTKLELFQTLWIEQLIETRNTLILARLYKAMLSLTSSHMPDKTEQLIWTSLIQANNSMGFQLLLQLREQQADVPRKMQFAKCWLSSLTHRNEIFEAGVQLKKDYPNNKRMRSVIDIITQDRLAALDVAEEKGGMIAVRAQEGQVRAPDEEKYAGNKKQIENLLKTGTSRFFVCSAPQHSYFAVHQKALKHSEDANDEFEMTRAEQEDRINRKLEKELGRVVHFSLR